MKKYKWLSLALAAVLTVASPLTAFATEAVDVDAVAVEDLPTNDVLPVREIILDENQMEDSYVATLENYDLEAEYSTFEGGNWSKYSTNVFFNALPNDTLKAWWVYNCNLCDELLEGRRSIDPNYPWLDILTFDSSPLQMAELVDMFRYSNPQYYFLDCGYVSTIDRSSHGLLVYEEFCDGNARANATATLFDNVNRWINELPASSQDQTIVNIHSMICNKVTYNYDALIYMQFGYDPFFSQTAYSPFVLGTTVCAGYAMATTLLCNAVGIPAIGVTGDGGGPHAWNEVCFNGTWYNFDATWDDYDSANTYRYNWFMVSDNILGQDHYADPGFEWLRPRCNATNNDSHNGASDPGPVFSNPGRTLNAEWFVEGGKSFWYENGVRQGTESDPKGIMGWDPDLGRMLNRGREICDFGTNGWYWLDSCYNGAKAVNKEVWVPYIHQDEYGWDDATKRAKSQMSGPLADLAYRCMVEGTGKWVRYDAKGAMVKGWYTVSGADCGLYPAQAGNTYYYDPITGLMAKGWVNIDGVNHHFDETTGVCTE